MLPTEQAAQKVNDQTQIIWKYSEGYAYLEDEGKVWQVRIVGSLDDGRAVVEFFTDQGVYFATALSNVTDEEHFDFWEALKRGPIL